MARVEIYSLTLLLAAGCATGSAPRGVQARYRADLAAVHLNYGNAGEAAALYREALHLEEAPGEQALYHQGLAQALAAAKDEPAARAELDRALGLYETLIRGSAQGAAQFLERYVRLAERSRAKRVIDEVAAAHAARSDPKGLVWLANVYGAMESPAEALKLYEMAEARTPDPAQKGHLRRSQAMLLARLRMYDRAEEVYVSLMKEASAEVAESARRDLVLLYAAQGRTDRLKLVEK